MDDLRTLRPCVADAIPEREERKREREREREGELAWVSYLYKLITHTIPPTTTYTASLLNSTQVR